MFADEKQLREDISEVYMAVAGNETAPSNMQTARITILKEELKKKEEAVVQVMNKYHAPVMKIIEKEVPPPAKKIIMAGKVGG